MKRNGGSRKAANVNKRAFPINPTKRKLYLLLALLLCSGVASAQVVIKGNVYGGGEGSTENVEHGQVTGNTSVIMNGGNVRLSIYGGGEFGSVGTFTGTTSVVYNEGEEDELTVEVPTECQSNTGLATVVLNGGKVGLGKYAVMPTPGTSTWDDAYGYVFAGGRGDADSISNPKSIACAVVGSTYLEINNGMLITASAYGGCENGLLLGDAHVKMKGGQIGVPYWETTEGGVQVQHWDTTSFYQSNYETLWTNAINAIRTGTEAQIIASAGSFHRCDAWPYGNNSGQYLVYDIFADPDHYPNYNSQGGALYATDGNTFFGKLYGGGSGYYPIAPGVWRKSAGRVNGNTLVEIEGGHILTSVFGGNELTDVVGSSTVLMSGGTVGIPETKAEIEGHPLHNHVFGSGFGDQRTAFNKWTNVGSSVVSITGGAVFGSVFGGGEEGHVLGNTQVNVQDVLNGTTVVSSPIIGTWGSTTFDGNVFGGGRGFVGGAYTAGGVGGNTEVNIEGGTMLGSVYGGGRLATIGACFVEPTNTNYGSLQPDEGSVTHGYTVVNIMGGTIGNRFELTTDELGFTKGGNVFGGSKGRLTLLNGSLNENWDKTGKVKQTEVNINKADGKNLVIKGHVYGGGEIGQVEQNTLVDIDNGTIGYEVTVGTNDYNLGGNVYGGGKGSPTEEKAGWVKGNSYVDMSNGYVQRSIYGGGEFGSVGTFLTYYTQTLGDHFAGEPETCKKGTGLASVIVSGGRVGLSEAKMPRPGTSAVDDDFGYIFAGSRGTNDLDAYPTKANILAVVDSTYLEISGQTLINASVYGGCENGLVLRDTKVLIAGGQIGNGYNGTSWDGVYPESQWNTVIDAIKAENPVATNINTLVQDFNECDAWPYSGDYLVYDIFDYDGGSSSNPSDGNSFFGNVFGGGSGYYPYAAGQWRRTAGRVYGNTNVEITGGHILTAVFGAGEISDVMGTSTVKMSGGTVGVPQTEAEIAGHPLNSHVFGGGKGDPRTYFNEWTNAQNTNVEITGGVVFGSVFGGGEDGHVLGNTNVTVKNKMNGTTVVSSPFIGTWGTTAFDGNLFGGGRGFSGQTPIVGGVVGNTFLTMEGGRVLGSVYGGGRMAAVGVKLSPSQGELPGTLYNDDAHGKATVTVSGGTVGNAYETDANTNGHMTGGNVYGGSRGSLYHLNGTTLNDNWANMAKVRNTDVNIAQEKDNIPTLIKGNVYGGGEIAQVTKNTDVDMTGGTVGTIAYDWKPSTTDHSQGMDTIYHITGGNVYGGGHGNSGKRDAAWVMNNSTVAIGGGQVWFNVYGGGEMASVGQRTITYDTEHPSQITAINPVANTGLASVTVTGGQVGPGPKVETGYNIPIGLNSYDGYVFGGGQGIGNDPMTADDPNGHYFDLCDVNYTNVTVNIPATADVNTNRIWGSVFGGSEDGHVLDNTSVTYESGLLGTFGTTSYDGNIFGGGRNYSGKNYVAGRVQGNTHIEMKGGQIYGNIYGGGRLALTGIDFARTQLDGNNHGRTMVLVKGGTVGNNTETGVTNPDGSKELLIETFSEHSMGNVYGGGMGSIKGLKVENSPATSALLVGLVKNTVVEVSEEDSENPTHIYGIVFGGGEVASVGKYTLTDTQVTAIDEDEGLAKVTISGGIIGADRAKMRYDLASTDPDDGNFWTKYNDDLGYVYGGGEGIVDDPEAKDEENNDVYPLVRFGSSDYRLIDLIASVNNTDVKFNGGWAKASVFGGAEAGHVMHNTKVTISGGQIGAGDDGTQDLRYTDESVFINPVVTPITDDNSLDGTYHWDYGNDYEGSTHYDPFDLVLLKQGKTPSDGKSWFGNVFGGGSGWFPYVKKNDNDEYQCYWNPLSGQVWGNTEVFIDGGHILNNVYGANEFTNVIGTASITMTDGTVGVPRTKTDIMEKPTFCYVFGGGCGDPRSDFDNNTNVASTNVNIEGGIVYGSVFGGAEDGHVLGNAVTTIGQVDDDPTVIGSSGTSGVDGNVFGGGRNYLAKTTTPGRVGGNTFVNIDGGTMLGSIYGGGRLGNVGVDINGEMMEGTDHGFTTVNVGVSTQNNNITIGHLAQDEDDYIGGNVYGGGKGLAGPSTSIYPNLGKVKQTLVNIDQQSKQTFVEGSVFGGGEDGHVLIDAYVNVDGGQIGGESWVATDETPVLCEDLFHGNVYGGGRGYDTYVDDQGVSHYSLTAGKVEGNTHVMITGGRVCRNVYGGGNLASVGNADEEPVNGVYQTGWANVTLTENAYVGVAPNSANRNGMVFGAGRGMAGETYKDLSMVKNTKVIITGNSKVTGTVYGSGEDGHTRRCTDILIGDATVGDATVEGRNVVIGTNGIPGLDGNVYGGGRGLDIDPSTGTYSSTAGLTGISTKVVINDGLVKGSVFGGGRLASVGYEDVLDLSSGSIPDDYGMATVLITGDAQIGTESSQYDNGHVFGSGKGNIGEYFVNLAYVHETDVTVNGKAKVYGSVFGGGEDGHVKAYTYTVGENTYTKEGNTHVTIGSPINNVLSTCNIGFQNMPSTDMDTLRGNVYGGGRGLDEELLNGQSNHSPTAGRVEGNTKVDILGGSVWHDVFGGGSEAVVMGQKVTNIVGGYVGEDVYGGSNFIPVTDAVWAHSGLKTVNIRGGQVHRNVYGCSHRSNDGEYEETPTPENAKKWTAFVNINGGTIDGSVHGAGYAGLVNGSVCVNIGANAIAASQNTPRNSANVNYNMPHTGMWNQTGIVPVEPQASKLVIGGSVYGGSDFYGTQTQTSDWDDYDQTGYALVFIDGKDYNTTDNTGDYMTINGGLYGSGTHSESGKLGRHILLKDYGTRNEASGEMTSATRTLTTIQRAGNVTIDHANVNLSGAYDISKAEPTPEGDLKYGVMKVDESLSVTNGSGIVLGTAAIPASGENPEVPGIPVFMDSIRQVKSLYLKNGVTNSYEAGDNDWEWIGIQNDDNHLYRIHASGTPTQLSAAQENVIIFNDISKLWVRYKGRPSNQPSAALNTYYGELRGFFRMRGEEYDPHDRDKESFAYARPKITQEAAQNDNIADGGWLSYTSGFNYFTDEGAQFTKTQQYPYINVLDYGKGDRVEYRMWVDPRQGTRWYVDGTRGWGQDKLKSEDIRVGRYPDKPKKTLFGKKDGVNSGVVNEQSLLDPYSYETDMIYVVGAISADDEKEIVRCATNSDGEYLHKYPLKLYRYPGGHNMSNNQIDYGTAQTAGYGTVVAGSNAGPGMNKGAIVDVQANKTLTMKGVVIDGLSNYTSEEAELHEINTAEGLPEASYFDTTLVTEPLIITHNQSTLSLGDSTVLMRGYNGTNADVWYTDAFYDAVNNDETGHRHGGAIFVDAGATVNVSDTVYITGNKQYLKVGNGEAQYVESNVFLPTFQKSLNITGALDESTNIGVTSPRGNNDPTYETNTLSPVATATTATIANAAWTNNNFTDDQQWFFGNGNKNTYYDSFNGGDGGSTELNFGWTWANVVRTKPTDFNYSDIDSPEDMAWLISKSVGMNGETATRFSGVNIKQTDDIDLGQYVWVPIGDSIIDSPDHLTFKGNFDGQGHLISNLSIKYIGTGDTRYNRQNYGLFGYVKGGTVKRTFVVSGTVNPEIAAANAYNIGGLVGCLEGEVSNSEAALSITAPNIASADMTIGGLVGKLESGEIHSSMAMPWITTLSNFNGTVGGLVGNANGNATASGAIYNSFVNGEFSLVGAPKAGGLLGANNGATVQNCYVNWGTQGSLGSTFKSIVNEVNSGTVDYCYDKHDIEIAAGTVGSHSTDYTPAASADLLGYMYKDNVIQTGTDTYMALFKRMNEWADANNTGGSHKYARWARPGMGEVNGDLPVLLLGEFDSENAYQGGFRSVSTYAGTTALQYCGPVRDGNELDAALTRPLKQRTDGSTIPEYLFVYGDINSVGTGLNINRSKVSIHEDVAILDAGSLAEFKDTYVGVTFDNSFGHATSTPGINFMGEQLLPRDWHMFSSPLSDAPQGFNYYHNDENTNANNGPTNNPWVTPNDEFSWLQYQGSNNNARYWMLGWDNSLSQLDPSSTLNTSKWQDGYFPSQTTTFGEGWISGTDEENRYPYGMDFYTWTEPDYHWINFKRNGPNHWHSDETSPREHAQIKYVNEDKLIVGRGYMGAIATETFMQSHGKLNDGEKSIALTKEGKYLTGWNLVGNPYHGYLDFDVVGDNMGPNGSVLSHHMNGETDEDAYYVVYDADSYNGEAATAFKYYPVKGSVGGDYASRYLHPHQGFYVKTEVGGSLTFKENMIVNRKQVDGSGSFRGEAKPAYPLVNLYLNSDNGCADVTVIEFERPEWGGARKLKELRVGDGLFYAHHDNAYYAALFAQQGVDRVPLWFEAKEDDIFTMKWNMANADFHSMYLIDNIAGVQYDMLKNDTYMFEGHTDDYPSRFLIVFDLTGLEEQEDEGEHPFAFFNGSEWVVTGDGDLQFIDMLGQVLAQKHISGQTHIYLPRVADGPYLFRLINGKETKIQKVIITK